jgi:hypothetical protein
VLPGEEGSARIKTEIAITRKIWIFLSLFFILVSFNKISGSNSRANPF